MEKILLHSCCAPCSAPILEWLIQNNYSPIIFFYNPNIYPREEYLIRKEECIRYANKLQVKFIDGDYDHEDWLRQIAGYEDEPERGKRCLECFRHRLSVTAQAAKEQSIACYTTTLLGSRWKSYDQICLAGKYADTLVGSVKFWDKDWKKGGLTERRRALLQENKFYNQQYCGCEFSIRK